MRLGLFENFDAGVKVTAPAGYVFDGKYMLVGNHSSPFVLSSGTKFGYMSIESTSGDITSEFTTMEFTIPVYISYYPVESIGISVIPDYTFRINTPSKGGSETYSLYGANTTLKIGKDWGLIAEYGYHMISDEEVDAIA